MNIKTARALRDILSIIIAACRDKNLESVVQIKIDRTQSGNQYIIIKFVKEVKDEQD